MAEGAPSLVEIATPRAWVHATEDAAPVLPSPPLSRDDGDHDDDDTGTSSGSSSGSDGISGSRQHLSPLVLFLKRAFIFLLSPLHKMDHSACLGVHQCNACGELALLCCPVILGAQCPLWLTETKPTSNRKTLQPRIEGLWKWKLSLPVIYLNPSDAHLPYFSLFFTLFLVCFVHLSVFLFCK